MQEGGLLVREPSLLHVYVPEFTSISSSQKNCLPQPLPRPVGFVLIRPPEEGGWVLDTTEETDWLRQVLLWVPQLFSPGPDTASFTPKVHCPFSSLSRFFLTKTLSRLVPHPSFPPQSVISASLPCRAWNTCTPSCLLPDVALDCGPTVALSLATPWAGNTPKHPRSTA